MQAFLEKLVDFVFYFLPFDRPRKDQLSRVKLVAHRGWHDNEAILENTIPSFTKAVEAKLYGIEFDIRWTKDLVPVVHHDAELTRLFGSEKRISELNFSELRTHFPDIPALAEVVNKYGKKIHFFIELKWEYFPDIIKQKNILSQVLSPLNAGEDFHLISLEERTLEQFNLYPKKNCLLVGIFNIEELSEQVLKNGWGGLTGHYLLFTDELIQKQKAAMKLTGTGFPSSSNPLKREINRGVDFIFTNHPETLLKALSDLAK